jgi:predicted nucleic acid-binding protein
MMDVRPGEVVLDTNVFVAAGFNPRSHSAWLLDLVRDGRLRIVWDDATRAEAEHVIRQIPRLSWTSMASLFRSEDRFGGSTNPEQFAFVPDPADRKFAALAVAADAPLVTSDAGLLNVGEQMSVPVLKPSEFARAFMERREGHGLAPNETKAGAAQSASQQSADGHTCAPRGLRPPGDR